MCIRDRYSTKCAQNYNLESPINRATHDFINAIELNQNITCLI